MESQRKQPVRIEVDNVSAFVQNSPGLGKQFLVLAGKVGADHGDRMTSGD
jgi:hypothetical protein